MTTKETTSVYRSQDGCDTEEIAEFADRQDAMRFIRQTIGEYFANPDCKFADGWNEGPENGCSYLWIG